MALYRTPVLDGRDQHVVARIGDLKQQLGHLLRVPRRWTGLLRRSAIGRAIRGSNSIEGYRFDERDVVAVAQGETVEASAETLQANDGYRRAMTHVLQLSRDPHFSWSEQVLKSLHFMMLEHDMDKSPGTWRSGPIFVFDEEKGERVYEGPESSLVPSLMSEFVADLSSSDDSIPDVVRAALAHLNLVMIHPFRDGNGRMARCVQTLVLGRCGTMDPAFSSIEEYLGRHQYPYYDALAEVGKGAWHPGNDALTFVRFCLRAHYYQASTVLRRAQEAEVIWAVMENLVQARGLPERTTGALWDAAHGYRVVNATYRAFAGVSQQVASRDLTALSAAGLLVAEGRKKGRSYRASEEVLELRRQHRESKTIPDPYQDQELAERVSTTASQ